MHALISQNIFSDIKLSGWIPDWVTFMKPTSKFGFKSMLYAWRKAFMCVFVETKFSYHKFNYQTTLAKKSSVSLADFFA